jgi:hypothetical protein
VFEHYTDTAAFISTWLNLLYESESPSSLGPFLPNLVPLLSRPLWELFLPFGQVSFLFHEVSIVIPSFILIFVNIFTIAKYVKYSKMKKKEKKKGKCIFGQVSILFHVASIVIPSFMFVISNFFTIAKTTLRAVYSKVEPNLARSLFFFNTWHILGDPYIVWSLFLNWYRMYLYL